MNGLPPRYRSPRVSRFGILVTGLSTVLHVDCVVDRHLSLKPSIVCFCGSTVRRRLRVYTRDSWNCGASDVRSVTDVIGDSSEGWFDLVVGVVDGIVMVGCATGAVWVIPVSPSFHLLSPAVHSSIGSWCLVSFFDGVGLDIRHPVPRSVCGCSVRRSNRHLARCPVDTQSGPV